MIPWFPGGHCDPWNHVECAMALDVVGLHDEESTIQSNLVIRNEVSLEGSFAYAPVDFADGFQWLVQGNLQIDPWLVKAPLADGGQCFERLLSQPGPAAKILLHS